MFRQRSFKLCSSDGGKICSVDETFIGTYDRKHCSAAAAAAAAGNRSSFFYLVLCSAVPDSRL